MFRVENKDSVNRGRQAIIIRATRMKSHVLTAVNMKYWMGRILRAYMASWGHAVALFVQALRYKPEGSEFDSR
jgi:hypothetical protein